MVRSMSHFAKVCTGVFLSLATSTCLLGLRAGSAQALAIDSIDTGWYTETGSNYAFNANYLAGNYSAFSYRSFFVFDLSSIDLPVGQAIASATLVTNAGGITDDNQLLSLFDYIGSIPDLLAEAGDVTAFNIWAKV